MDQRLKIQGKLETLCDHVYFQPPESIRMKYPCIVYKSRGGDDNYADNDRYLTVDEWEAVVVDRDPDSRIPRAVLAAFRYSRRGQPYTADNLHHFPITIKTIYEEDIENV